MSDEPDALHTLGDQQPAIDTREPDRIDPEVPQGGDQLAVHDSPKDGRGDLERSGICDPEPALESGLDPEPLEPLGHPLAAAMDDDDRAAAGEDRDLLEDVLLVGEGGAAELDHDDPAAHRGVPCLGAAASPRAVASPRREAPARRAARPCPAAPARRRDRAARPPHRAGRRPRMRCPSTHARG